MAKIDSIFKKETKRIGIYHLKADSAKGRLFIWKISSLAVVKKPISAYGIGNFVYAYGQEQEKYFAWCRFHSFFVPVG